MRDLITTLLELAGMLLLVASATVLAWQSLGPVAGLSAAGAGALGCSVVIELRAPKPIPAEELD